MSTHLGRIFDGINGVASNASVASEVVDASDFGTVWFQIDLDDASDPDFTIAVWTGLVPSAATLGIVPLTVGDITATSGAATEAGVTLGANGTIQVAGATLAADGMILFSVQNISRYFDLRLTAGGGGTTGARLTARYWLCDPR